MNDTHGIPAGDEPGHLTAFLDQNPKTGEVFTDQHDRPWFVVVRWSEVFLVNSGGSQQSPATVCERHGPLARAYPVAAPAKTHDLAVHAVREAIRIVVDDEADDWRLHLPHDAAKALGQILKILTPAQVAILADALMDGAL